jgi:hypothetical protein
VESLTSRLTSTLPSFPGKLIQRLGDPRIELRNHERTVGRMSPPKMLCRRRAEPVGAGISRCRAPWYRLTI